MTVRARSYRYLPEPYILRGPRYILRLDQWDVHRWTFRHGHYMPGSSAIPRVAWARMAPGGFHAKRLGVRNQAHPRRPAPRRQHWGGHDPYLPDLHLPAGRRRADHRLRVFQDS